MKTANPSLRKQKYWALGDLAITMSLVQASIVKALRRDHWTWNGITGAARDELHWGIDDNQLGGEQLCQLAADILGYKSCEFDDKDKE